MEHLFMQIFERRDWIAGQLRQQGESFAQSVASNLLADGGVLPPWLWTAAAGSDCWGTHGHLELNNEQVISGILYSLPHSTIPIGHTAFSGKPFQKDANLPRPKSFVAETCVETPISVSNCYPGHNGNQDTIMDSLVKVQNFSVVQREKQVNLGKQRKLTDDLSKQRSAAEYTGRITRSRATSIKTYHIKESLDLRNLSKPPVEFDDMITHKHVISSNAKETQTSLSARDAPVRSVVDDKATPTTTGVCSQQLSNINLLGRPTGPSKDKGACKYRRPNASHCSRQSEDAIHATSGSGYSKRRKVEHRQSNCFANSPSLRISLHLDEDGNHSLKERPGDGVGTCEPFEQCQLLKELEKGVSYSCHENPPECLYQSEQTQAKLNVLDLERKEDRTCASLPQQHMQKESYLDCHVGGQTDPDSPKSMDDSEINASTEMPLALKESVTINGLEISGRFEHCHGSKEVLEEISYSGHKNTLESFHQPEKSQAEENDFHLERKEDEMPTSLLQCTNEENSFDCHVGQVDRDSPRSMDELEVNESTVLPLVLNESTSVNCWENDESFQQCHVLKEVLKEISCPCNENPLEYFHRSGKPQGEESNFHSEREDRISTLLLSHMREESSLDCHLGGQADRDSPWSMDGLKNNESTVLPHVSRQSVSVDYLEVNESFELYHVLKEVENENSYSSHQNPPNRLHQSDKCQEEEVLENDFHLERKEDKMSTLFLQHVRDKTSLDCHVVDQADGDPSRSMDNLIINKTTESPLLLKESDSLKDLETNESFEECHVLHEVEKEISCSCHEHPPDCLHHGEKPQAEENDFYLVRNEDRMSTSFTRHMQKVDSLDCSVGGNMHGDSPKTICDSENNDSTGQPLVLQEAVTVNDEISMSNIPNALAHGHLEPTCIQQVLQNAQSQDETKCQVLLSPVRSSHSGQSGFAIPAEAMPELEGFSIDSPIMENDFFFDDPNLEKLTRARASALEQLRRSMNISTSISRFSTEHRIHRVPDVCQSFPSELLKCMSWDDHLQSSSTDDDNVGTANHGSLPHGHCKTAARIGRSLFEKSGSHSSPFSSAQLFNSVTKGPSTPPVEKFSHKVLLERKGWSSDRIVSNPELTCFRIDEHARSPEESVCREECQDTSKESFGSRERGFSSNRGPLADVTSIYHNAAAIIGSTAKKDLDPIVVGSIETKISFSMENGCGSSHTISKVQNKENGFFSASRNNVQKVAASLQNRLSKVSLKADDEKRSQATLERKASNVVSNVSSFVPLVRQKQQLIAPITGKRDIKVKALEAAEAAKRQAEKKENERKMRKEAARLERMRLEQENARQLELKQRKKEEEKKKKEADIATRKRQREKEEREEKRRKKNCIEGARQRKAHEDRVRVEDKDLQLKALDDKEHKKKALTEAGIQHKTEKGQKIAEAVRSIEMDQDRTNIAGDARNVSNNLQSCEAPDNSKTSYKIIGFSSELEQAMHDRNVTLKENRQSQSYEISPYRDSDDEEGEDDKRPKKKFVPSWARRESLDEHLFSMRRLDPTKIFGRKRSFDLSEVLSFRTRQRAF